MAIARWSPSSELTSLHSAMDRLFEDMFESTSAEPGRKVTATYRLPVDVVESEQGYLIKAPLAGFKPEDVEITFSEGILTISAKHSEEHERKEGAYLRREVAWGNYVRQIALPGDVQADHIKASFDNGLLMLEVPRTPKPQPRRIEVKPGSRSRETAASSSSKG